jgi:hypothetical protein
MGRSPCCDESGLKKGPWTPEEDQKLVKYIQKHGHGSWRALPKLAGICLSIFLYGAQLHLYLSLALTSSIFLQVLTDVEKVAG